MPGTLFVVATPIGNLEDITLRALRVLRSADLIAAEDTRRTARLLAAHAITTRTVSFHEHNTRARVPQLLARLQAGESVALVTDAGTPGISDPGVELVRACIESDVPIDPIPGVSAPLAAVVASGFPLEPLTVFGFPPARSKDRKIWFQAISTVNNTLTFFEAPHRIKRTLQEGLIYFVDRPIMLARELTKVHQEFLRGSAERLSEHLAEKPRGEFTIVLGPMTNSTRVNGAVDDGNIALLFCELTNTGGLTRRETLTATARRLGISTRSVYAAIERTKNR